MSEYTFDKGTHELLRTILDELKAIRKAVESPIVLQAPAGNKPVAPIVAPAVKGKGAQA